MYPLGDREGAVTRQFAARIGVRMARFNPFDAGRQICVLVGADRDRLAYRKMRRRDEGRRHCGCRFADGNDVKASSGQHVHDLGIGECARDHPAGADRIDTGADHVFEILLEPGDRNRQ